MKRSPIFDLTHLMHEEMPVWPGKGQPAFPENSTIEQTGYREKRVEIDGHTGTHIDAPAHMVISAKTLDQYPVSHFTGEALLIPIPQGTREITLSMLNKWQEEIDKADYLLIRTGWSQFWGKDRYLEGFPVFTPEAAHWLTRQNLKGIGLDTISADPVESEECPIHQILFRGDLVIVENLIFPPEMEEGFHFFAALPLLIEGSDGSPVRAIAIPAGETGNRSFSSLYRDQK